MEQKVKERLRKLVHWQYFPLLVLLLVILGLHLCTITRPDTPLFDEHHYVTDARRILTGEGSDRTEHPPLGKLLIAGGIELFGDNQWGWRLPEILLSTVALAVFYDICRKLGTSHKTAFIAVMLLGLDNLMFIHSGMVMLDIYLVVFTIFAFWCYLKGPRWWWLCAISIGLAGLCKFSGALSAIPIGLHWFITYMSNMTPQAEKTTATASEDDLVDTQEKPVFESGQIVDGSIAVAASANSTLVAEDKTTICTSSDTSNPAEAPPQTSSAKNTKPLARLWHIFSNPIIFISSMMLAPITFFLFYGIFDMIIRGEWIPFIVWGQWDQGVLGTIKGALNSTNSIKFAYGGAFPAKPWEWILSPTGSLRLYGALFQPEKYDTFILAYWWRPSYSGIISPSMWLGGLMTIPYVIWKSFKQHSAAIFVVCWIIGTWVMWIPMFLLTERITYMFYYLPTLGAIAIGVALILTDWLNKAQSLSSGISRHVLKLTACSFLLVHLLSFCIISPLHLWISVPVCALLFLFSLSYLGFGRRFTIQFGIAACVSALIMRFGSYWLLRGLLVTGSYPWKLPDVTLLWAVSALIGIALAWGLFAVIHMRSSVFPCLRGLPRSLMRKQAKTEEALTQPTDETVDADEQPPA
ncbi:MAG: glycosyltransferase family 39 protein [Dehalococcoidia bacterium]|nr:glycosyltransferase family 39 protein [Dehalococcoidia bacterium]